MSKTKKKKKRVFYRYVVHVMVGLNRISAGPFDTKKEAMTRKRIFDTIPKSGVPWIEKQGWEIL